MNQLQVKLNKSTIKNDNFDTKSMAFDTKSMVTEGGGGGLVKASRNRHEGGVKDFLEPTKCDFEICPFFFL